MEVNVLSILKISYWTPPLVVVAHFLGVIVVGLFLYRHSDGINVFVTTYIKC